MAAVARRAERALGSGWLALQNALPAVLLAVAVVLGGGGSPTPSTELLLQLVTLLLLTVGISAGVRPLALWRQDRHWAALMAAIVAFPLLQLVPLPPALWSALPRREAAAALAAVGAGDSWHPWSLLPDGGIAAVLALIPAAVCALFVSRLAIPDRVRLMVVMTALGGIAALTGIVQFIRGADHPLSLYADIHRGWGIGFFANRNAQADLIAIALIAGVLLVDRYRERLTSPAAGAATGIGLLLLLAGGVATGSRMGMAMLAIPVLLALFLAGRRAPGLAAALAAGAAVLLLGGTALDRVTARAGDAGNRAEIWGDSVFVARQVAPFGAGMGSFVPLYAAAERLDHVQPTIANRAHNDWLELAIEGGVPALLLLAVLLAFVGIRARRGWGDDDPDRRLLARFAGLTMLVFALHSTVDYPLRTLTLLTVAGLALGGLARGIAFAPGGPHSVAQEQGFRGLSHA